MDVQAAIKMRENGATYQQIGDTLGVTKQRVYAVIGRRRRNSTDLKKIRNKDLRKYFEQNAISYSAFAKIIGCSRDRGTIAKIERFIKGESEASLTAEQWANFCEVTGLTLRSLLAEDK